MKWRGRIPLDAFDIVDEYTADVKAKLVDVLKENKEGSQPTSSGVQTKASASAPEGTGSQPTSKGAILAKSGARPKSADALKSKAQPPTRPPARRVPVPPPDDPFEKKQKLSDDTPEDEVAFFL